MSALELVALAGTPRGFVDADNPWPGLAAFREGDHAFFHGREAETETLYTAVLRGRLTILFGLSGLGKTSLLQAGLFPRLREHGYLPVYLRLDYSHESPPLALQVKTAVLAAAAEARVEAPVFAAAETLWECFHRQNARFWSARNRPVTPVLVFDQFEEAFTLGHRDAPEAAATRSLLAELAELVEGRAPASVKDRCEEGEGVARRYSFGQHPYKVLFSLREDFLPELECLRRSMPSVVHNRLRLLPMNGEDARRALRATGGALISPEVADQLVHFVAGVKPDDELGFEDLRVEPTLLSLVCYELNERRKASGEAAITSALLNGIRDQILSDFYDRCMASVAPEVRALVQDSLLTAKGFRNSIAEDDALATPGVSREDLDHLQRAYLIRREDRCGVTRIELMHDVLAPVVLAKRDADSRDKKAEDARKEAEAARQQARRRARRLCWTAGLTMALTLAAAGAITWEVLRTRESARQTERLLAELEAQEAHRLLNADRGSDALRHLSLAVKLDPTNVSIRATLLALLIERGWWLPQVASVLADGRVVAISQDGARYVTASNAGIAKVWAAATHDAVSRDLDHGGWIYSAQFSPDGSHIVTASDDTAIVWNVSTGDKSLTLGDHRGPVFSARFSADGRRIVTASRDGRARVWNAKTGYSIGRPLEHSAAVKHAQFSPDGRRVVTAADEEAGAQVWDVRSGQRLGWPLRHDGAVLWAEWSPDGRRIVTAASDRTAKVWDVGTGRALGKPLRHQGPVTSAVFSADGRRVATTSADRTARVWDTGRAESIGEPIGEPLSHGAGVYLAQFGAGGRLLTAAWDWTLTEWSTPGSPARETLLTHAEPVVSATWSGDGRCIGPVTEDGAKRYWNAISGEPLGSSDPSCQDAPPTSGDALEAHIAFDETTRKGRVQVREIKTGKAVGKIIDQDARLASARVSGDGRRLATTTEDGTTTAWDVFTGEAIGEAVRSEAAVRDVEWSPEGERMVIALEKGGARVWDVRSGRPIGNALPHEGAVLLARFSPDGQRLVTASAAGRARVWDVPTGSASDSERALLLAGAVAGFDKQGKPLTTSAARALILALRRPDSPSRAREEGTESVLRWVLADPSVRTLSPLSKGSTE
jgi:WD40 repeat protein